MLDYYFCEECETYHHPNRIINGQILGVCERQISIESNGLDQRPTSSKINNFNIQNSANSTMNNLNRQFNSTGITFTYQNLNTPRVAQGMTPIMSPRSTATNTPYMRIAEEEIQPKINRIRYLNKRSISPEIAIISPRKVGPQLGRLREVSPSPRISRAVSPLPVQPPRVMRVENIRTFSPQLPFKIVTQTPIQSIKTIPQNLTAIQTLVLPLTTNQTRLYNQEQQIPPKFQTMTNTKKINVKSRSPRFTLQRVSQTNDIEQEGYQQDQYKKKCCGNIFYS